MKKFRSIREAVKEIRRDDPTTAISEYEIRRAIKAGLIPCRMAGRKHIVAIEDIEVYYLGG